MNDSVVVLAQMKEKIPIKVIILVVFILTLGAAFYFYQKYQSAKKSLQDARQPAQLDKEKLIKEVGKLIELPKEEATVAVISDREKLKDQPFFQNAKNGDKVLIFTNAKKAILYRPSSNKIIEVAPINLGSPSASMQSDNSTISPTQKVGVKVAIYNGTKIAGLAAQTEKDLKEKVAGIEVVEKGNTVGDYNSTIIVDISGRNKKTVEQIAQGIEGEVVEILPAGEKKPEADILVIVGK